MNVNELDDICETICKEVLAGVEERGRLSDTGKEVCLKAVDSLIRPCLRRIRGSILDNPCQSFTRSEVIDILPVRWSISVHYDHQSGDNYSLDIQYYKGFDEVCKGLHSGLCHKYGKL